MFLAKIMWTRMHFCESAGYVVTRTAHIACNGGRKTVNAEAVILKTFFDDSNLLAWLKPRKSPPNEEDVWNKLALDQPDLGDYASFDLALLRQQYCNDQYNYAVTRAQARECKQPLKIPDHYRQKIGEEKPQRAVRMSGRLKAKISQGIIEPTVVKPVQVDPKVKKPQVQSVKIDAELKLCSVMDWIREQNAD